MTLLSHWLARHVGDEELRRELAAADTSGLNGSSREAVEELRAELDDAASQGDLERVVRETLEALALGT
ncbi:MAG: hypothetical protein WAQ33_10155 [Gaiellaceae bacterium]